MNQVSDVKRDLLVGVAQWLATPGEPRQNLSVALGMMDDAASRGVELLVLPELWSCGYDPETLAEDARRDAEPRDGPPQRRAWPRRPGATSMWLAAGSVPELGEDGAAVRHGARVQPAGRARGVAPQGPSLSRRRPSRPCSPRATGSRRSTDPSLGTVGLVVCFDGDFPEVARTLALRGARLILAPSPTRSRAPPAWDLLYPALALTNSQWWVQANQAGSHATSTLLGASRIVAPTGTVVAEASRAVPGSPSRAELLVHRIDLHLAYQRDGIAACSRTSADPPYFDRATAGPERAARSSSR